MYPIYHWKWIIGDLKTLYLSLLNIRCLYVSVIEYGVFWNVGVGAFNVKTENCFEYNL